jgi:hypothetical protein
MREHGQVLLLGNLARHPEPRYTRLYSLSPSIPRYSLSEEIKEETTLLTPAQLAE